MLITSFILIPTSKSSSKTTSLLMSQMDLTSSKWVQMISCRFVSSLAWKSSQGQQLFPRSFRQSSTLLFYSLISAEQLWNRRSFPIQALSWSSISDHSKFSNANWFCSKSKDILHCWDNKIRHSLKWDSKILLDIVSQISLESVVSQQSPVMRLSRQSYLMNG